MPADRYDPATVELVVEALTPGRNADRDYYRRQAVAVLDALTAAGKLRRSPYAGEGEARCGEPHPDGGPPCQLRPGHETHIRPASGGFEQVDRETVDQVVLLHEGGDHA
jgi:hypothetical protein